MKTTEMLSIDRSKMANNQNNNQNDSQNTSQNQNQPLRECVKQALENYFTHLEGHTPADLYDLVLEEIEIPLLEAVMLYVRGNQCKAAILLGISRGTLRKLLQKYNLS